MEARISRLEADLHEERAARSRMEASLIRIEAMMASTLPHLATKADIADLRAETRAEFAELRAETKGDIAALRADTHADFAALRVETNADFAALRVETNADFAALRAETKADFAALRAETKADFAGIRLDIARLDADKPSKIYMWGILAVLLTAYGCGLAALAVLK